MCPLCNIFACQQYMWVYARSGTVPVCMRVHACGHWPCACACMCVFWVIRVTQLSFLWCGWTVILSSQCHVLWNMLAAFVVPLPVLLFWHFHTIVHLNTVMLLSLSNYYSLNSSSQERLASQCRIHGTRYIIEEQQQGLSITTERRWWLTLHWLMLAYFQFHCSYRTMQGVMLMLFSVFPYLNNWHNFLL